jgi:uncharacterized protein (DUF2141 family)
MQSPLPSTNAGFTILALLALCISCSAKSNPSTMEPGAMEIAGANPALAKTSGLDLPSIATPPSPVSIDPSDASKTEVFQVKIVGIANTQGNCRIAVYASPRGFHNPDIAITKETIQLSKNSNDSGQLKNDELVWSFALPPEVDASQAGNPTSARSSAGDENTTDAIPEIRLAITAFHDANGNGELDKSAIGIPTEKYGFSKNPAPGFGPPSFDQTAIPLSQLQSQGSPVEIKLR